MNDIYLHLNIKTGEIGVHAYPTGEKINLHEYLIDMLSHTTKKSKVTVNFYGLSNCKDLIFNILYRMGYTPIKTTRKKDMRVNQFRYAIGRDKCFYIQVKVHEKAFLTFQNVECIIGSEDLTLSGKEIFGLYYEVRDFYERDLKRKGRVLYTISGMSRNLFSRVNPDYSKTMGIFKGYNRKINKLPMNVFLEKYCRPAVRGGFMFNNGYGYTGPGISLDVNSIYPYVSRETFLPTTHFIGAWNGKPERIKEDWYYIYKVKVYGMRCKSIPCICRDKSLTGADYITEIKDKRDPKTHEKIPGSVVLTLTETDIELLNENYDYTDIEYLSYICFVKSKTPFTKFFDMLYEYKRNSTGAKRNVSKLFLNTFIGNFMRKPFTKEDYISDDGDGYLRTHTRYLTPEEIAENESKVSGLCYIGAAILAAARKKIIHDIKSIPNYQDRWIYSDTDSIYLKGYDIPKEVRISDDMGAYKVEHKFDRSVFYGNKQYILSEAGKVVYKLAGVPMVSRQMIENPEAWIYTEKHTKRTLQRLKKSLAHKHLEKLFCEKLPIISSYTDYESEEVALKVEWQRIVDYKKHEKQKAVYSDFHRLDGKSEYDIKVSRAVDMYNRHHEELNPENSFEKAAEILRKLISGETPKEVLHEKEAEKTN